MSDTKNRHDDGGLQYIQSIFSQSLTLAIYPHRLGGFYVSLVDKNDGELVLANHPSDVWAAVSAGVMQQLVTQQACSPTSTSMACVPVDIDVMNRITRWIGPSRWIEATIDKLGHVIVTIHDFEDRRSWNFHREYMSSGLPEITGATRTGYVHTFWTRGRGRTFWAACENAFNNERTYTT